MANNLVAGVNGAKAKADITFALAGITAVNCLVIFKIFNPTASYNPAPGSLNTITGFEENEFYYVIMKEAADLSNHLETRLNPSDGTTPVDPTGDFFLDNFVGAAGAYSGHTPDVGTALNPTTGGLLAVTLDGSGKAVFPGGGFAKIVPQGTLPTNRKVTVIVTALDIGAGNAFIISLKNGGGDYINVSALHSSAGGITHNIQNTAGVAAGQVLTGITLPFTFTAQILNGVVSTSINGANTITATATGTGDLAEVVSSNGGTLESMKVEAL